MWKLVAVAVLGLVGPLLVSTPLSAADTHGAPAVRTVQTDDTR